MRKDGLHREVEQVSQRIKSGFCGLHASGLPLPLVRNGASTSKSTYPLAVMRE